MKVVMPIEQCCGPLLRAPLSQAEADQLAAAFRVVADAARLRLLSLIAGNPNGEACACELVEPLGLSQPTVSHHLKVLHEAGLLDRDKRGVWVYYRASSQALAGLAALIGSTAAS